MAYSTRLDESFYAADSADLRDSFYDVATISVRFTYLDGAGIIEVVDSLNSSIAT